MVSISTSALFGLLPFLSGMSTLLAAANPISDISERDDAPILRYVSLSPENKVTIIVPAAGSKRYTRDLNFAATSDGTGATRIRTYFPSARADEVETNAFLVEAGGSTAQCHLEIDETKVRLRDVFKHENAHPGPEIKYSNAVFWFQPGEFYLYPCGYNQTQEWVRVVCGGWTRENPDSLCVKGESWRDWLLHRPAGK